MQCVNFLKELHLLLCYSCTVLRGIMQRYNSVQQLDRSVNIFVLTLTWCVFLFGLLLKKDGEITDQRKRSSCFFSSLPLLSFSLLGPWQAWFHQSLLKGRKNNSARLICYHKRLLQAGHALFSFRAQGVIILFTAF